ncbi:hypothetical protein CN540_20185 [Bacillus toyonensis]|uniref:DUF4209 domain-containing protein n=1 Tax=Bacillus toyonensis TaxID=155322 RepID=UPI000BF06759|nr:hypothetical protein CN540_20185 [Bacillus toyonensis]
MEFFLILELTYSIPSLHLSNSISLITNGLFFSSNSLYGGVDTFLLGNILASSELKEALGEDALFYLKLVYNDARGHNLRDNMDHGLMPPSFFNRFTT